MICPKAIEQYGGDVAFKPSRGTGPLHHEGLQPERTPLRRQEPELLAEGSPELDGILWKRSLKTAPARRCCARAESPVRLHTIPANRRDHSRASRDRSLVEPSIISRYLIINNQKKSSPIRACSASDQLRDQQGSAREGRLRGLRRADDGRHSEGDFKVRKPRRLALDPKKARELLAEAGFPNGFETELWSGYNNATAAKVIQFIQQQLRQVGIKTNLRTLEAGQRVAMIESVRTVESPEPSLLHRLVQLHGRTRLVPAPDLRQPQRAAGAGERGLLRQQEGGRTLRQGAP